MEKLSKESKYNLTSLVMILIAIPVVIWLRDLPSPPWGASFMYSVGWYAGEIFSRFENLFR